MTIEHPVSEQDKTIATVVLAGYGIVPLDKTSVAHHYKVIRPNGQLLGWRSTRYTAALLAEADLNHRLILTAAVSP